MKNKYNFWTNCFNIVFLLGWLSLVGCTKLKSDFSYSPSLPCAGSVVSFTNESTGADDYNWSFGDNTTSTSHNPTHIYRKPGTYTVTLQIIRNKVEKRTCSHQVTVIDTIPTLVASADTIYTYTPVTYSAAIYNPWSKSLHFSWRLPANVVVQSVAEDSSSVTCFFTKETTNDTVFLQLQQGDKTYNLSNNQSILHKPSISVLYRSNQQAYEHFAYYVSDSLMFQKPQPAVAPADSILNAEQDTIYIHGNQIFTIQRVSDMIGQPVTGFQVDRLMSKIYAYNTHGLWVCNINGDALRQLLSESVLAIKVDGGNNRLYWSTGSGLYVHRLLHMSNNIDAFLPVQINSVGSIQRLSVNYYQH